MKNVNNALPMVWISQTQRFDIHLIFIFESLPPQRFHFTLTKKAVDNSKILGFICLLLSLLCGFVSALISLPLLSGSSVRVTFAQYTAAYGNGRFMQNANDSTLRGRIIWGHDSISFLWLKLANSFAFFNVRCFFWGRLVNKWCADRSQRHQHVSSVREELAGGERTDRWGQKQWSCSEAWMHCTGDRRKWNFSEEKCWRLH